MYQEEWGNILLPKQSRKPRSTERADSMPSNVAGACANLLEEPFCKKPPTRKVSRIISVRRWEVPMNYLNRYHPSSSCCWDGAGYIDRNWCCTLPLPDWRDVQDICHLSGGPLTATYRPDLSCAVCLAFHLVLFMLLVLLLLLLAYSSTLWMEVIWSSEIWTVSKLHELITQKIILFRSALLLIVVIKYVIKNCDFIFIRTVINN